MSLFVILVSPYIIWYYTAKSNELQQKSRAVLLHKDWEGRAFCP